MPRRKILRSEITPKVLRELLLCDPVEGKLFWRERTLKWFPHQRACDSWNARFAGKEAFLTSENGYLVGAILGVKMRAHRVIWAMTYGQIPHQIDHENGCRSVNRLINLQAATPLSNARNRALSHKNTSGVLGVYWHTRRERWVAQISAGNRQVTIGYYRDKGAAINARKAAEKEQGYHFNHGRRA